MGHDLKTWLKHIALFLTTLFTMTIAGLMHPFGFIPLHSHSELPATDSIIQELRYFPQIYFDTVSTILGLFFSDEGYYLAYGLKFSLSFLFMMTCHEFGHYIACRIYKVDATLPYFIPTPPLIGPGTFGAFIKIKGYLPSRRAVFDIGVAGPIAGFVALIPIAFLAFANWQYASTEPYMPTGDSLYFSDGLFTRMMAMIFNVDLTLPTMPNPYYTAMWFGLLVTSLNLIPSGQLDGGHAIYAVFGGRFHKVTGYIAFGAMATFSVLGWFIYSTPSGFLFTVLLAFMMRIGHPQPLEDTPLDRKRLIVAFLTLVIFILCFVPFPIQLY